MIPNAHTESPKCLLSLPLKGWRGIVAREGRNRFGLREARCRADPCRRSEDGTRWKGCTMMRGGMGSLRWLVGWMIGVESSIQCRPRQRMFRRQMTSDVTESLVQVVGMFGLYVSSECLKGDKSQ